MPVLVVVWSLAKECLSLQFIDKSGKCGCY